MAAFEMDLRVSLAGGGRVCGGKKYSAGPIPAGRGHPGGANRSGPGIAMAIAGLQVLVIVATCNMTLKTNNASTPTDNIPLIANVPYVWTVDGDYDDCLITAAITGLYVTTAEGVSGNLKLRAISDVTPPA